MFALEADSVVESVQGEDQYVSQQRVQAALGGPSAGGWLRVNIPRCVGWLLHLMLLFAFVAADPPAYAGVTLPDQRADELVSTEPVGEPYLPPTPFEQGHANPGE